MLQTYTNGTLAGSVQVSLVKRSTGAIHKIYYTYFYMYLASAGTLPTDVYNPPEQDWALYCAWFGLNEASFKLLGARVALPNLSFHPPSYFFPSLPLLTFVKHGGGFGNGGQMASSANGPEKVKQCIGNATGNLKPKAWSVITYNAGNDK